MIRANSLRLLMQRTFIRCKSESTTYIEKLEEEASTSVDVIDEEAAAREAEIEKKRNKSRLNKVHYHMLHEQPPHLEPALWLQGTVKFQRKMYGRYGAASKVNPALCWPTEKEFSDRKEYENVAYPFTINEMVDTIRKERQYDQEYIEKRQKKIVENVQKLEKWKADLKKRMEEEENKATAAKRSKDRLVEEVRKHFGYTVDPRSDKFKEMLEKKEKEQKKESKLARKKMREEKLMAFLSNKSSGTKTNNEGVKETETVK